jgi:hypothetical protein
MADLIYVGVIIGFFEVATLFVVACDHIIGPDENAADVEPDLERIAA